MQPKATERLEMQKHLKRLQYNSHKKAYKSEANEMLSIQKPLKGLQYKTTQVIESMKPLEGLQ